MKIDDKTRDEKKQYDINREATKISTHYHKIKLININILQANEYYLLMKAK